MQFKSLKLALSLPEKEMGTSFHTWRNEFLPCLTGRCATITSSDELGPYFVTILTMVAFQVKLVGFVFVLFIVVHLHKHYDRRTRVSCLANPPVWLYKTPCLTFFVLVGNRKQQLSFLFFFSCISLLIFRYPSWKKRYNRL